MAAVACPAPALAQDAGGLYTPFPNRLRQDYSLEFVRDLPGRSPELGELGTQDLRRGVVFGAAPPSSPGEASERAGETTRAGGPSLPAGLEALLLIAGLAAGGLALARRT